MALNTFYWIKRNASFYKFYKNKLLHPERCYLRYGNAGDMFNVDLINEILEVVRFFCSNTYEMRFLI